MNSDRKILPGDRITVHGPFSWADSTYTVGTILYQDWYGDRVRAGASDCWGYDIEFKDDQGRYHHWKQNQDHGIVKRKSGQYWLPVSDDGCLRRGDQITIRWTDDAGKDGYALVVYEGTSLLDRSYVFRSVMYGWTYTLSRHLDKLIQENHPYEPLKPDNCSGWLRYIP